MCCSTRTQPREKPEKPKNIAAQGITANTPKRKTRKTQAVIRAILGFFDNGFY